MARFPWIQVTQETWGKARALGGVLGMSRREAFGLICDLWAWALEQGPDDRPPSGEVPGPLAAQLVAGAVEWTGDAALLVSALEACGLLARGIRTGSERDPNGVAEGLRVRGVDRYESTWKKNRMGGKKTQSERDPNGIRTDTARFPNAQTQTQTHREATTFAGASRAAPGQAPPRSEEHVRPAPTSGREDNRASDGEQAQLLDVPAEQPQKRERKRSRQEEIFHAFQEYRRARCEEEGVACHVEDDDVRKINSRFAQWKRIPKGDDGMRVLNRAFEAYLNNERFRSQGWSVWLFMTAGIYAEHVRLSQTEERAS